MQIRRLTVALLTGALLTGCAPGGGTSPAPTPRDSSPISGDAGTGDSPGSQGSSGAEAPDFSVKPAPNALQRVTYNSVREIPGPGIYVIDLPTGKVETWQRPGILADQGQVHLSDDRRWAVSETADQVYWANRQSGRVFGWSRHDLQLVAAGPSQFLFAKVQEGAGPHTFFVADANFQVQRTFTLDLGQRSVTQAQFAPDGKTVALNTGRWPVPDGKPDARIYVVDVATGTSRDLGNLPTSPAGPLVGLELLGPAASELVVSHVVQVMDPTGLTREQSIVRRYSWQGQRLGEFTLAGRAGRLSPDGRLLVWGQELGYLTSTAVVTDLATGQPRFRVVGAFAEQWTADGSRLVLLSRSGAEYLVSASGELKQAPPIPHSDQPVFMARLVPAPDDPRRFVAGLTVVDDSGQVLQTIQLPKRNDWLIRNGDWGASANELLIDIWPPTGKGNLGFDFPLAPQVQKPPFADPYLLKVQDAKGECLNLRESFTRSSRVIRCLSTGTKLAVADLAQAPIKLNQAFYYNDEQIWLWARTEGGETGWVSLSSGSVTWAQ